MRAPGVPCLSVVSDIKSETRALINRPRGDLLITETITKDQKQEMPFYTNSVCTDSRYPVERFAEPPAHLDSTIVHTH